jgi:putative membrane protein
MYDGHMFGFGGGFMWLFWIAVIVAIVFMVKLFLGNGSDQDNEPKSAEEILKERYAKGEIDREEFERKRKDLNGYRKEN